MSSSSGSTSTLESLRGSLVTAELALGVGASLLSDDQEAAFTHPVVNSTLLSLSNMTSGTIATGQFSKILNTLALSTCSNACVRETLPLLENHALPGEKRRRQHVESTLLHSAPGVAPSVAQSAVASVLAEQVNEDVFTVFYGALNELRSRHHATNSFASNVAADTLEDEVVFSLQKPSGDSDPRLNRFSEDEVCGRFLDFNAVMEANRQAINNTLGIKDTPAFCQWLLDASSSSSAGEELLAADLKEKKKLVKVINDVVEYLVDYKNRVQPLMPLKEIVSNESMGKVWEKVKSEWCPEGSKQDIDLDKIKTKADLDKYEVEVITSALTQRGMKAGGTKAQKIDRLMNAVGVSDLSKIAAKHMAAKGAATPADNNSALFVLDFQCAALLRHYRPTLLQSCERNKRRRGQTVAEKIHERNEILTGTSLEIKEEESDDEEEIYNPKNLPLGWDGKPIPVWLYKLHGLNKFFHCEICGDETYRGQRDYEKHFGESKHSYGMKCLKIPNSKHFHGITKVEDAKALWAKINGGAGGGEGGGGGVGGVGGGGGSRAAAAAGEEQFEDADGNVMSKAAWEGMARQGLL
jgi:splicing factor 3A subunit 3